MRKRHYFFIVCSVLFLISALYLYPQGKYGSIQGKVVDRATQQPLSNVHVSLLGTHFKAKTDNQGQFRLDGVPVNSYQILFELKSFKPIAITDIVVDTGHVNQLLIEMDLAVIEEAITVTADYFSKEATTFTSTRNLSYEEIRRMPGAAEDISRVIQSMPGVAVSNDMKNDIIVRGGSPSENLFIIDNIQIPNINHFGVQGASGGAIGLINPDFIHDINFYSGGFPAFFGDKLSSALKIILREGSRDGFYGDINLCMAGFGGTFEGPLSSKKGSWMFSLRRSYLELLSGSIGMTAVPEYWDLQAKVVYDFSNRNQLSILGVGGIEKIQVENSDDPIMNYMEMDNRQREYVLGISLRTLWGKNGYSILTLSTSYNKFFHDVNDEGGTENKRNSFEEEYALKFDFEYSLTPYTQIASGLSYKRVESENEIFDRHGYEDFGIYYLPQSIQLDLSSYKAAAYLQLTHHFHPMLRATLGIRGDYFDYIHRTSFSPRFGLSCNISPRLSLNFSYGRYFQSPEYIWLISHPDNSSLKFLQADNYTLGWEFLLMKDTKLTIEIFDKEYKNYPVDTNDPYYTLANSGVDFGYSFLGGKLQSKGTGFARGVEVFLQKKLARMLYGLINYSYSVIKYKALDGVLRPGDFDCRHVFTSIIGFKPSDSWEFSVKWRYAGGRPYSPFDEERSKRTSHGEIDLSQINALRLPSYHRLDLRFDKRYHFKGWNLVAYFDLQNAYNRSNVYGIVWDKKEERVETIYHWRIMPVGGFSIEF